MKLMKVTFSRSDHLVDDVDAGDTLGDRVFHL